MLDLLPTAALIALTFLGDHPTAPDGRRGFGDQLTIQEVQKLLHSPKGDDEVFVDRLFNLESQVEVRTLKVRVAYEEQGYFDLLERTDEHELAPLHEAFVNQIAGARASLEETGEFPPAMARVWPDIAFVLRAELLSTLERDLHDVGGGLTFLLATRNGYTDVRTREARMVMKRIDLGASRLRALVLDLDLLSQSDMWVREARELEKRLLALADITTASARADEFARIEESLKKRLESARSMLFTTRLAEKIQAEETARDWSIAEAEGYLTELLPWIPTTPEGKEAPKEVQELPKHKRYVSALRLAMGGLSIDPLNAELCYYAAISSDFLYGEIEAVNWYDRYLALRGIRAFEKSTTKGKKMTAKERKAYDVVQRRDLRPR